MSSLRRTVYRYWATSLNGRPEAVEQVFSYYRSILANSLIERPGRRGYEFSIKSAKFPYFTFGGWAVFVRTLIPSSATRKTRRASYDEVFGGEYDNRYRLCLSSSQM